MAKGALLRVFKESNPLAKLLAGWKDTNDKAMLKILSAEEMPLHGSTWTNAGKQVRRDPDTTAGRPRRRRHTVASHHARLLLASPLLLAIVRHLGELAGRDVCCVHWIAVRGSAHRDTHEPRRAQPRGCAVSRAVRHRAARL